MFIFRHQKHDMGFYIVLLLLCFYLLYTLVENMFQNLLDEFSIDKKQPLSIGKNNFTFSHSCNN